MSVRSATDRDFLHPVSNHAKAVVSSARAQLAAKRAMQEMIKYNPMRIANYAVEEAQIQAGKELAYSGSDTGPEIEMVSMQGMDLLTGCTTLEPGKSRLSQIPKTTQIKQLQILPELPDLSDSAPELTRGQKFDRFCHHFFKSYIRLNKAYETFDLQIAKDTYHYIEKKLSGIRILSWLGPVVIAFLAFCFVTLPLSTLRFILGTLPGFAFGFVLLIGKLFKGAYNLWCQYSENKKAQAVVQKQLKLDQEEQKKNAHYAHLRERAHFELIGICQNATVDSPELNDTLIEALQKSTQLIIEAARESGNFYENCKEQFKKSYLEFQDLAKRNFPNRPELIPHLQVMMIEAFYDELIDEYLKDVNRPSLKAFLKSWPPAMQEQLLLKLEPLGQDYFDRAILACDTQIQQAEARMAALNNEWELNGVKVEKHVNDSLAIFKPSKGEELTRETVAITANLQQQLSLIKQKKKEKELLMQQKGPFLEDLFFLTVPIKGVPSSQIPASDASIYQQALREAGL